MTTITSNIGKKIYKPRPSAGWVWVGILGLFLLGTGLSLVILRQTDPFMITTLLTVPIGIAFLVIAGFFPSMRYEIGDTRLILTYGPLLRYVIQLDQIRSIKRRDLGISLLSSLRFPGLALFSVPYPEIGRVKMCATAASTGILLIETESGTYGITPADEQQFVDELRKRMRK